MNLLQWCRNEWERTVAVLAVLLGLVAFLLGWLGLSDKSLVTQQVPYLVSGALFGIFLLGVAATLWLSADMHDEWVKLDRLQEAVERAVPPDAQSTPASTSTSTSESDVSSENGRAAVREHA